MDRKGTNLERFMTYFGRYHPIHFGFRLRVSGTIAATALRNALDAVKKKNPLIAVRTFLDDKKVQFVTSEGVAPFSITEYPPSERPWTEILLEEVIKPFRTDNEPGCRFALRPAGGSTELFGVFHHAFIDGVAGIALFDDLLTVLSGTGRLEENDGDCNLYEALRPEIEEILSKRKAPDWGPLPVVDPELIRQRLARPYAAPSFSLHAIDLGRENTERFIAAAKAEETTVNALLGAAWLSASAAVFAPETGWTRKIQCPVDFRPYMREDVRKGIGVFNGIVMADIDCSPGRSLGQIAHEIKEKLDAIRAEYKDIEEYYHYRDSLAGIEDPDVLIASFPPDVINYDFSLSNIGKIALKESYGDLRVEEVFGPTFSAVNGETVIGVNTHGGALRMTYIYDPAACDEPKALRVLEGFKANFRKLTGNELKVLTTRGGD